MKRSIITIITASIISPLLYAGVTIDMKCSNERCGFKSQYLEGRGKHATVVPGYCVHCKKMVSVTFKRSEEKLLAQIWSSKTGETLNIYECPHCKKPFAQTKQILFCPKCKQKTISTKRVLKW